MTGVCICCGANGPVESHHVGRRKYSRIVLDVCLPCHSYLTVTDVHERRWSSAHPVDRISLGMVDVLARFADGIGLPGYGAMARQLARCMGEFSGYRYVPSAVLTDGPDSSKSSLPYRVRELTGAMLAFHDVCEGYRASES